MEKKKKEGKYRSQRQSWVSQKVAKVVSALYWLDSPSPIQGYSSPRRCLTGCSRNSQRGLDFPWPNAGTGGKDMRAGREGHREWEEERGCWFRKKVLEEAGLGVEFSST